MKVTEQEWSVFSSLEKAIILWYLRYKYLRYKARPPLKYRTALNLARTHLLITLFTLSLMPPPPELPIIAVPLTWGASLTTTLIIWRF